MIGTDDDIFPSSEADVKESEKESESKKPKSYFDLYPSTEPDVKTEEKEKEEKTEIAEGEDDEEEEEEEDKKNS